MSEISKVLRVIQITDCHIRIEPHAVLRGTDVDAGLSAVLAHIQQHHWPADLMLATGDLVHEDLDAYGRLRAFLEPLQIPVYCLPGNHDDAQALKQSMNSGLVQYKRLIDAGNWRFLMLDTSIPRSDAGRLAADELSFLKTELERSTEQSIMICLHHQPVPIGSVWLDTMMVENNTEFWHIVDQHPQVKAVVWGHIHQTFSEQRAAMQLLATPSTCCQFTPNVVEPEIDTEALPGYRWFELHADGSLKTGVERVALP